MKLEDVEELMRLREAYRLSLEHRTRMQSLNQVTLFFSGYTSVTLNDVDKIRDILVAEAETKVAAAKAALQEMGVEFD